MSNHNQLIDDHVRKNLDAYIAETARLCAQPSVSARSEGTRECAPLVAEILRAHGLDVQSFDTPGNPILVGRARGKSARTLLFYNHYDVQPPEPLELWTTPPYQPTVRDGALYARGSKDDKGELIARLAAVDAARSAHNGELPCGVTFVVEGEEEIGSPHIAEFVQTHKELLKSDCAIWEEGGMDSEGRPVISLGRRGVLGVELEVKTISRDAHSGSAHILPSAAWRLVWALASLKDRAENILIPGFYDAVKPVSALDAKIIAARPSDEEHTKQEYSVKEFLRGVTGDAYKRAVFQPTCNVQGITTGYQGAGNKTVIPARATAKLDFRLVPDQDPRDIFEKLKQHLARAGFADVDVKWNGAMWPSRQDSNDPSVKLHARTAREVYGKDAVMIPIGGGSSPVYAFAGPLNIPVISPGVGYDGSRTHSPNENVRLEDFYNAARHIARIVNEFANL
ncbi:MAG: M20/M25/M40 family metallo-hydrolase [Chloroflexi bacterium]|nr:M20/M25/M40 family metallo-hydrolase [Chloroflexota bacterium]